MNFHPHAHTDAGFGHGHPSAASGFGSRMSLAAHTVFLLAAATLLVFYRGTPAFSTFSITFAAIVLEALPFVLLGALVGGGIEAFVSRERMLRFLPASPVLAVLAAGGLGMFFPVCECAIVPVVRRLLGKGFPLGAAVAFLLGGPIVNPLVGASTFMAYGGAWSLALERMATGFGVAVAVGLTVNRLFDRSDAVVATLPVHDRCACCGNHPSKIASKAVAAFRHAMEEFLDVGRFLVIGAFVAGALQSLVARQILVDISGTPVVATAAMMVLALVLNLCSEADAFVAASFRGSGIPLTAQMAFMVLGPMLDVKLLLMYLSVFRKRFIAILASLVVALVFSVMTVKGMVGGW